jgi:hypothetical protein
MFDLIWRLDAAHARYFAFLIGRISELAIAG